MLRCMITPYITKQDTCMRTSITPEEKLAVDSGSPSFISETNNEAVVLSQFISDAQLTTLKNEIVQAMKKKLPQMIVAQMTTVISPLEGRLKELQGSVTFLSEKYDDFSIKVEKLVLDSQRHDELVNKNIAEISRLNETVRFLEEQLSECNIEIHGVNESKSENLLEDYDVVKVTRVAKINKDNKKPRTIAAKLTPRRRDEFLSSMSRYRVIRRDRDSNFLKTHYKDHGGGVLIALSKHINYELLNVNDTDLEDLWVRLHLNGFIINLCVVYIPAHIPIAVFKQVASY
ncbi:unnamed protein product [Leptidea sinapis]|uniref:Uncharacterized protein n=1 Tax=Leptidea sinapis TaxID=189913 RepID=A0A5E4QVI0_9NEOP|nr:unnamed protein product [Leptidea sinapis]